GHRVHAVAKPGGRARGRLVLHRPGEDVDAVVPDPADVQVAGGFQGDLGDPLGLAVKLAAAGHGPVALYPEVRGVGARDRPVRAVVAGRDHDVGLVHVPAHAGHVTPPGDLDLDGVVDRFER